MILRYSLAVDVAAPHANPKAPPARLDLTKLIPLHEWQSEKGMILQRICSEIDALFVEAGTNAEAIHKQLARTKKLPR